LHDPQSEPPASAAGRLAKPPTSAAASDLIWNPERESGVSTPNGMMSTPASAAVAPAIAQTALCTRRSSTPAKRAASGFCASARTRMPNSVRFSRTVNPSATAAPITSSAIRCEGMIALPTLMPLVIENREWPGSVGVPIRLQMSPTAPCSTPARPNDTISFTTCDAPAIGPKTNFRIAIPSNAPNAIVIASARPTGIHCTRSSSVKLT